jgi:transposase InsO family protein
MCQVFKVSKSGYYYWKSAKPSSRALQSIRLIKQIEGLYSSSKGRYGSPKITNDLNDMGWLVSRPRVARIMRSLGLKSIVCKKFRGSTTDSRHNFPVADNVLNRDFDAQYPAQKWVSDITYIPTDQGWMYLTIILDLFDRKVVGWSLSTTMTAQDTVLSAWRMAIINRPISSKLIFHSDQGVQYACYAFSNTLKNRGVIQSMSRKGNCWDNAVAENFFKTLKTELIRHVKFHNYLKAKNEIFQFIEVWYNRKRKHQSLGYKSPEQYTKIYYSKSA